MILTLMIQFIVDTQLPPVLATYLRRKGWNAVHTTNYPQAQFLTDSEIRAIATDENRIVVTKDEDFADYFWAKSSPPRVLLLRVGNIKNNDLINLFEANLNTVVELFEADADLVIFGPSELVAY